MYVLLELTNNCIIECVQCMTKAGPGKDSATKEDLEKIISNLSENTGAIMLTGGEVFTKRDLLEWTIKYLRKVKPEISSITVQTNGYWAKDIEKTKKTLQFFMELGVSTFHVSSNKIYHKLAGLDMVARQNLIDLGSEGFSIQVADSKDHYQVFPAGGGWNVSSENWADELNAYCWQMDQYSGIGMRGEVYSCWWFIKGTELGDAREEKVDSILERAKENRIIKYLNPKKGGAIILAREVGLGQEEINQIEAYKKAGNCGLCSYLFKECLVKLC